MKHKSRLTSITRDQELDYLKVMALQQFGKPAMNLINQLHLVKSPHHIKSNSMILNALLNWFILWRKHTQYFENKKLCNNRIKVIKRLLKAIQEQDVFGDTIRKM